MKTQQREQNCIFIVDALQLLCFLGAEIHKNLTHSRNSFFIFLLFCLQKDNSLNAHNGKFPMKNSFTKKRSDEGEKKEEKKF